MGCLSVCMSVCLFACLSVCLFVCLSVCLFVCMFVCLSVCLFVCLSVCLLVCLCLSVCMFVCLLWELVCSTVSCTYDSEDSILVKLVVLCSCGRRRTHVSLHRVVGVNSPWYQVVVLTVWPYSPLTLAVQ